MSQKYLVPKDIEQAVPIAGVHPVDLSFSVMLFSFGIVAKSLLISVGLMLGVLYLLKKLRKGVKRGYSQHYGWRIGISFLESKLTSKYPHPAVNDFVS